MPPKPSRQSWGPKQRLLACRDLDPEHIWLLLAWLGLGAQAFGVPPGCRQAQVRSGQRVPRAWAPRVLAPSLLARVESPLDLVQGQSLQQDNGGRGDIRGLSAPHPDPHGPHTATSWASSEHVWRVGPSRHSGWIRVLKPPYHRLYKYVGRTVAREAPWTGGA